MSSDNIKEYGLFIEEEAGKKPKRILKKKLASSDFGKTFTHKIYLDFIPDGVPKAEYGEIAVKVGEQIPINKPPTVQTTSNVVVKPSEVVKILATIIDPEKQPLTVKWELTGGTTDFKEGNEGDSYWIEFTAPAEDSDFSFRVTATDDKGAVAYGNVTVKVRKEPIPEPEPKPQVKLGQIGDTHGDQEGVTLLKTREKCDIVIHTGDVTDTESDDDGYINAVNQAGYKYGEDLLNCQGNHSSQEEGGEGAQEDMENAFPLLKQTNWLQFLVKGNVAIIINNTQISGYSQLDSIASKHVMDSLEKVKQLRAEGKIDWVVFAQHKPLYTLQGGHDPEYNFRYNHHKAMDDAGVDFFFDGHVHNVQRTFPIMFGGDGTNVPPIVNSKKIGDAHDTSVIPHGIICIVNGSSTKSHSLSENSNSWTPFATDDTNSYSILEFNGKKCTGKIVDISSGSVQHEFKVAKEEDTSPSPAVPVIKPDTLSGKYGEIITVDGSSSQNTTSYSWSVSTGLSLQGPAMNPTAQIILGTTDGNVTLTVTNAEGKPSTISKPVYVQTTPPPNGDETDSYGLKWMVAKGQQSIIEMSRDEADDDRWSGNVTGLAEGFEATFIGKSIGTSSGSHFAMKMFGGNHSKGDWKNQRWYDLGIRSDGTIQLQWEGPHPDNHDFTLPDTKQFIKKLSKELEGNWIGLKWSTLKLSGENGSPSNGGVRVRMWVDEDPIDVATGKPKNNWKLACDFVDGVDATVIDPQSFSAPDEQDCEVRRSNTEQHDVFGDGKIYNDAQDGTPALHVRALASPAEARTIEGKIVRVALSEGHSKPKEKVVKVPKSEGHKIKKEGNKKERFEGKKYKKYSA